MVDIARLGSSDSRPIEHLEIGEVCYFDESGEQNMRGFIEAVKHRPF